jgi:two-component system nitrogen regulation response regulator NtrX
MERLVILHPQKRIEVRHLSLDSGRKQSGPKSDGFTSLHEVKEAAERDYILKKLDETGGNVTRASELLGLERSNLYRKMKALGIAPKE